VQTWQGVKQVLSAKQRLVIDREADPVISNDDAETAGFEGERRLVVYRGVSFQLANSPEKASWKLAPRLNPHLPHS
jgi:hypothetical protein